jgi:predicted GIY-YIG superfamily endonuclease
LQQLFVVKRYYVYMLECRDGSFYIGITSDLEKRVGQHHAGWSPTCYTHERRPVRLVYSEEFAHVDEAIRWEKQIKKWSRLKKMALARGDWEAVRRFGHGRPSTSSG